MSVGNLKDYGNKGNNFPYQLKVLQGLSLGQCSKLEEFSLNAPTFNALKTALNLTYQTYPDSYIVSKSVIFDGTNYVAYLTLAHR
jgi:hypothetical protein